MKQRRQLTTTMHLAQDCKRTYSAVVVQEVLQKQEPRRWGAQWPAFRSWQQPTESHHRSWSSYNYSRSSPTTQRRPFYGHLAFKANWKGEKAQWVSRELTTNPKKLFWSVISYCMQQHENVAIKCSRGKSMLIVMVPILFHKDVFEQPYNDLKFTVWNHNYFCTNLILCSI